MPAAYRGKFPLTNVSPDALVVHCSAARYQPHFSDFLQNGLKLDDYSLIVIPGGVHALTVTDHLPKFSWAMSRWAKFLVDADKPPRMILIGHQDCRWYKALKSWESSEVQNQRIVADLHHSRKELTGRFPNLRVDLYYARLDPEEHVLFETV